MNQNYPASANVQQEPSADQTPNSAPAGSAVLEVQSGTFGTETAETTQGGPQEPQQPGATVTHRGIAAQSNGGEEQKNAAGQDLQQTRDLLVVASVVVIFLGSLVPVSVSGPARMLWSTPRLFFLGIGVVLPLIVGGLFAARRLNRSEPRIGSLTLDQFASVVASYTCAFFFFELLAHFRVGAAIGFTGALALVILTVCAPWFPMWRTDAQTPRQPFASPVEEPSRISGHSGGTAHGPESRYGSSVENHEGDRERQTAENSRSNSEHRTVRGATSVSRRPFWFAVATPRVLLDPSTGAKIFTLEPGHWYLALEDRGREFLVRWDEASPVGVLRDLENIERASDA